MANSTAKGHLAALDAVNHCISLKLPWLFLIALVAVMGGIYLIVSAK